VWGEPRTWDQFVDQLEDAGCEVIEDQSIDCDDWDQEEIYEDLIDINYLRTHTDYVPYA